MIYRIEQDGSLCNHHWASAIHTGIFDLKIIANNAILLVISISTTFMHLGSRRVSNEAKNFKELEFLGLSR